MGRRVADILENLFQFMVAFAVSLYLCWQLTVVLLASFPLIAAAGKLDHDQGLIILYPFIHFITSRFIFETCNRLMKHTYSL